MITELSNRHDARVRLSDIVVEFREQPDYGACCHGRGREFESRRARHSFHRSCRNFNETNEGTKGQVFVPFLVPFFQIAMKSDEAICSVPAVPVRVRVR
jgi:hypothetical protein